MITCCPYCNTVTSKGGTVEWRGLQVDWEPASVSYGGELVQGATRTPTRFLHVLAAAEGRPVRIGLFNTMIGMDAGENTRSVHFAKLRRWLRETGLPFAIPKATSRCGYRLVALDAVRLAA